jgi:hypothetical protein
MNVTARSNCHCNSLLDELPVTEEATGALAGIIRKKDLIMAYNDELLKRKGAAGLRKTERSRLPETR